MIRETFNAYKFMLNVCFRIAPSVKCDDIKVIVCDEFLSNNFVDEIELINTSLFLIIITWILTSKRYIYI